jgi:hypothetical protein
VFLFLAKLPILAKRKKERKKKKPLWRWQVCQWHFLFLGKKNGILEISVKSRKDSTSSLVRSYTGWDEKKTCKKIHLAFNGVKLRKPSWLSPCLSFFPERLHFCYIDFHWSYLYSYYNSSWTLCIKCWDSAFRTEFQNFILRFNKISLLSGYHWKRGERLKGGPKTGKTGWLYRYLYCHDIMRIIGFFFFFFLGVGIRYV